MIRIMLLSVFCLGSLIGVAQGSTQKIDELLTAYARLYKFNGSALVAQNGKILLQKGYGWKNQKDSTKNDENTLYQIGSVTKQFTASIILKLQEQKKLSVKNKLRKFFPDLPLADGLRSSKCLPILPGFTIIQGIKHLWRKRQ